MKRPIICGGRDFHNRMVVWESLNRIYESHGPFEIIIHGAASGADTEAMFWGVKRGLKHMPFIANWELYGKRAGPVRNEKMIVDGRADGVIAFPGGKGTANMIKLADKYKLPVIIVTPPQESRE